MVCCSLSHGTFSTPAVCDRIAPRRSQTPPHRGTNRPRNRSRTDREARVPDAPRAANYASRSAARPALASRRPARRSPARLSDAGLEVVRPHRVSVAHPRRPQHLHAPGEHRALYSSHVETVDVLVASTARRVDLHLAELIDGGAVIFDPDATSTERMVPSAGFAPVPVPLTKFAQGGRRPDHGATPSHLARRSRSCTSRSTTSPTRSARSSHTRHPRSPSRT